MKKRKSLTSKQVREREKADFVVDYAAFNVFAMKDGEPIPVFENGYETLQEFQEAMEDLSRQGVFEGMNVVIWM